MIYGVSRPSNEAKYSDGIAYNFSIPLIFVFLVSQDCFFFPLILI